MLFLDALITAVLACHRRDIGQSVEADVTRQHFFDRQYTGIERQDSAGNFGLPVAGQEPLDNREETWVDGKQKSSPAAARPWR